MRKSIRNIRKNRGEQHSKLGALFKEFILGGQDGLVNVLGIILGISIATNSPKFVIVAGLAATFAEAFSMGAVVYTSTKAEIDYYKCQEKKELYEMANIAKKERKEIYDIYYKKGFRGKLLNSIVKHITSDNKIWLNIMMKEELGLSDEFVHPLKNAFVVLLASIIGSLIPLFPFFLLPIKTAIIGSLIVSALALFVTGALEAKFTVGNWIKKGIQLTVIGMMAALIGFLVGKFFGA